MVQLAISAMISIHRDGFIIIIIIISSDEFLLSLRLHR
jgi:hypothetical protein